MAACCRLYGAAIRKRRYRNVLCEHHMTKPPAIPTGIAGRELRYGMTFLIPVTVISTRRFLARPSEVALVAMGTVSP